MSSKSTKSFHNASWDLPPPAAPVFDPVFYPAYLHGTGGAIAALSAALEDKNTDTQSGVMPPPMYKSGETDPVKRAIQLIQDGNFERATYLTPLTPFQRYLADYKAYAEFLAEHKRALHERKVVERIQRKKFKLGLAEADTPEMNKGVSYRVAVADQELGGNLRDHLAWHPREKVDPVAPTSDLSVAKKQLAKAKKSAKVQIIKDKAANLPVLTSNILKQDTKAKTVALEEKSLKLDFKKKVIANRRENIEVAAKAVSGAQLARAKKGLERVESSRAVLFKRNGKVTTFPLPAEGEFLRVAKPVDAFKRDGSPNEFAWNQLRFGSIDTEATYHEIGGGPKRTVRFKIPSLSTITPSTEDRTTGSYPSLMPSLAKAT